MKTMLLFALAAFAAMADNHPWGNFKPGSWVKMKSTTNAGPSKITSETKMTLIEKTATNAVVETESTVMGQSTKTRANIPLNATGTATPGVKPATMPTTGNETLTVAGKQVACKWFESESNTNGMKVNSKSWTSDAVPGGMVKSVSKMSGAMKSETTVEVVAFEAK